MLSLKYCLSSGYRIILVRFLNEDYSYLAVCQYLTDQRKIRGTYLIYSGWHTYSTLKGLLNLLRRAYLFYSWVT